MQRGFADSSRTVPSADGLVHDAKSVWNWLLDEKRVPAGNIIVAGQSLGTGVATQLVVRHLIPDGAISSMTSTCEIVEANQSQVQRPRLYS